jgi:predicted RND superfamily exporter protein
MIDEMDILYSVGIVALSLLSTILVTSLTILKKKNKELLKRVLSLDEAANESYIKFLSDSRDWAYEYIEEVQAKLTDFANKVEPQLNYYNTYGMLVQGPHIIFVKEINEAYEDLKTILPQENKEK